MIRSSAENSRSDEQLVAEFRQTEDPACIEILFNRYCQLVFAVAMKYLHQADESKDAVIEIFENIPASIRRYEIKNFSHWIYIVTKNHCFRKLKKRKKNLPAEVLEFIPAAEQDVTAETEDFQGLLMEHLEESLNTLNREQRICITQFYLELKSYEEIEHSTGLTYNQVKSHIQNGKRNLKIYLSRYLK